MQIIGIDTFVVDAGWSLRPPPRSSMEASP